MTDTATVLELSDVAKSFGSVAALRAGSLVARAGSIHALVGENGAGKSTLVKIIAGSTAATPVSSGSTARTVDFQLDRRVEGRRHRGDLPGADPLPDLTSPRTSSSAASPPTRWGRIDRSRDAARGP